MLGWTVARFIGALVDNQLVGAWNRDTGGILLDRMPDRRWPRRAQDHRK